MLARLSRVQYSDREMSDQALEAQEQALLSTLGGRLRALREQRSLTVTELADRAGVSRRYITDAEAGRANLSILKLARIARPLRASLSDICDLPSLGTQGERIALIGLRGAGKSTLGRELAQRLEVPFVELDERIERRAGLSLAAIFDLQGVETYRRLEREALEEVLAEGQRQVIATGGSIVTSPATYERLREACRTVWLRAAPEHHLQRVLDQGDHRPIDGHPRALEELREILDRRSELYALALDHVETSERAASDVIEDLVARLTL